MEYLNTLEEGLGEIEQRSYCQNTVINAVLSTLLSRAERAGIAVSVRAVIPGDIPFESSDVSILLANSLENAVSLRRAAVSSFVISLAALVRLVFSLCWYRSLAPLLTYNALFVPIFAMAGLLCLVMSALFRQAAEMKAENDLTI